MQTRPIAATLLLAALAGCTAPAPSTKKPDTTRAGTRPATPDSSPQLTAIPPIPDGQLGASIRRGLALMTATRDSLPQFNPSGARCVSCHMENGLKATAIPLSGVYARFPQYSERLGVVISLEDRVNSCFTRSLAGKPLPVGSREMQDIVAYLAHISRGVPVGRHVHGEGLAKMHRLPSDTTRGQQVFAARCARCHGAEGQGIPPAPPLWGPRSFGIGASMAREERAAAFIKRNMPFDSAGALTDQQAFDVATYIASRPHPDTKGKAGDWPKGGAPYDIPYATFQHEAYRPGKVLRPLL